MLLNRQTPNVMLGGKQVRRVMAGTYQVWPNPLPPLPPGPRIVTLRGQDGEALIPSNGKTGFIVDTTIWPASIFLDGTAVGTSADTSRTLDLGARIHNQTVAAGGWRWWDGIPFGRNDEGWVSWSVTDAAGVSHLDDLARVAVGDTITLSTGFSFAVVEIHNFAPGHFEFRADLSKATGTKPDATADGTTTTMTATVASQRNLFTIDVPADGRTHRVTATAGQGGDLLHAADSYLVMHANESGTDLTAVMQVSGTRGVVWFKITGPDAGDIHWHADSDDFWRNVSPGVVNSGVAVWTDPGLQSVDWNWPLIMGFLPGPNHSIDAITTAVPPPSGIAFTAAAQTDVTAVGITGTTSAPNVKITWPWGPATGAGPADQIVTVSPMGEFRAYRDFDPWLQSLGRSGTHDVIVTELGGGGATKTLTATLA